MLDPPRLLERWLERLLPGGARGESVLGDLAEEFARRSARTSLWRARWWYGREALLLGMRYGAERVRRWSRSARARGPGTSLEGGRRGGRMITGLAWDVRHGVRALRKSPGFTVMAVLALALGIGTNAGTFAFIDAMAFRPLPVAEPEGLVALYGARRDARLLSFSYADWIDYRERGSDAFTDIAGFHETAVGLSDGDARMVWTQLVTPNYFDVLGPRVQLGRRLAAEDEAAVVLSDRLWQVRFGGDRGVIGRSIRLNGQPFTVVGVTGPRFTGTRLFTYAPQLWVPIRALPRLTPGTEGWLTGRGGGWLQLVGRLRPGVSREQAESVANGIARALGESFPATHAGRTVTLYPNDRPQNVWAFEPSRLRLAGSLTMVGVALVLLIACANVTNLQLARATTRGRDVAIRLSLGASRGRVVRQRLVESVLLSLAGGALGIGVALALLRVGATLQPTLDFAAAFEPAIEWRVLLFTLLAAVFAGAMAGALPALREARSDPASTLRASSGGAPAPSRLLDALVTVQVAVSVVVLVAAGLFAQSLEQQRRIDPGFPLGHALMVTLDPTLQGYPSARAAALHQRLLAELRALPGVRAATRASTIPLDSNSRMARVSPEGAAAPDDAVSAWYYAVEPGWFETLGTPLLEGRDFAAGDTIGAPLVAIVNRTLARRLWPDGSAVGRRLQKGQVSAEVIGVAPDTKLMGLREEAQPMIAFSVRQEPTDQSTLLLRTSSDPAALAPAVRRAVAGIDPTLALMGVKTLEEGTRHTLSAVQGGAVGSGMFGLLALLLTVAGLYGVVSFSVARRAREIGIRTALGARATDVIVMVVRRGMRLVAIGVGVGLLGAIAVSRALRGFLYGIAGTDVLTFAVVVVVIVLVSAFASWLPARRAALVDPLQVLRAD